MGNEQSSQLSEPNPYSSVVRIGRQSIPDGDHSVSRSGSRRSNTGGGMRRSQSTLQDANSLGLTSKSSVSSAGSSSTDGATAAPRYIPNMNRAGKGLNMPSRPYGYRGPSSQGNAAISNAGSEMSPQWGWYINTTPPSPEMYHGGSRLIPSSGTNGMAAVPPVDHQRHPNHVFRNLQGANAPMGWTSVPI